MKLVQNMKKNWLYWSIGAAVIFAIIYMKKDKIASLIMKRNGQLEEDAPTDGAIVLKKGSRGAEVAELQRRLNSEGAALNVDGIFGPLTEAALQQIKGVKQIALNQFRLGNFSVNSEDVVTTEIAYN